MSSSAGRRPARTRQYPRHFLLLGDEVRALMRMRPILRSAYWRNVVLPRGYVLAIDRRNRTVSRLYVRFDTNLSEFLADLNHGFTMLDRWDILTADGTDMRAAHAQYTSLREAYKPRQPPPNAYLGVDGFTVYINPTTPEWREYLRIYDRRGRRRAHPLTDEELEIVL